MAWVIAHDSRFIVDTGNQDQMSGAIIVEQLEKVDGTAYMSIMK